MRALLLLVLLTLPALARPGPQWADKPPEIRQWFQSVMQPDNPYMSCCGEADAYDVDIVGEDPDGSIDVRILAGPYQELIGETISVPREKLQARYGNPLDKYILFMGSDERIYCLIPKVGA